MPNTRFDVVIAGLGAMGSAIAFHLAARGMRVVAFDRGAPPHADGSSHGGSRAIREAYFEDPRYVPLVRRAFALWRALEARSGRALLRTTGAVMLGPAECELVAGALRSAREHGIAHEALTADEVTRRFPALRPAEGTIGVVEPGAGVLHPEECVAAHLEAAAAAGADLRSGEPVASWRAHAGRVEIATPRGWYTAGRLVLAAGAWIAPLVSELAPPLRVERQTVAWLVPRRAAPFAPGACPIWIAEYAPGRHVYGFPLDAQGVKVAFHHEGETVDPDVHRRTVSGDEVARVRAQVQRFVPDADGPLRAARVCLYTNTPDGHFLVDMHPAHPEVTLVSACSGHGFKFASAIGEAVAATIAGETPAVDLELFRWRWESTPMLARETTT